MSRWAETFAALSVSSDTSDTRDKRASPISPALPCVACVETVETSPEMARSGTKSAEILNYPVSSKPSVPCVTTVKVGEKAEAGSPSAAHAGAFDTSATLATEADSFDERAALIACGAGVPRRWAEGYAALCSMSPPAGFYPGRWQRIVDAAGKFLDQWASKAIACGWSDLEVFGCDPDRPDARFDCMACSCCWTAARSLISTSTEPISSLCLTRRDSVIAAGHCLPTRCRCGSSLGAIEHRDGACGPST